MQNPEIQLCNSKMKCAAKTSYARNYDHPECSTRTKYNTTTYYIQRRAFINVVIDSESIQQRPEHCPKNKQTLFGQFWLAGHSYKSIV